MEFAGSRPARPCGDQVARPRRRPQSHPRRDRRDRIRVRAVIPGARCIRRFRRGIRVLAGLATRPPEPREIVGPVPGRQEFLSRRIALRVQRFSVFSVDAEIEKVDGRRVDPNRPGADPGLVQVGLIAPDEHGGDQPFQHRRRPQHPQRAQARDHLVVAFGQVRQHRDTERRPARPLSGRAGRTSRSGSSTARRRPPGWR